MTISHLSVLPLGSGLAIRSLLRPFQVIRAIRVTRGVMAGQREINANFSGNRMYACPNRVQDRPCFSDGPISQRSYVDRAVDLIHYPYFREALKNERARSAGVQIGTRYANLSPGISLWILAAICATNCQVDSPSKPASRFVTLTK